MRKDLLPRAAEPEPRSVLKQATTASASVPRRLELSSCLETANSVPVVERMAAANRFRCQTTADAERFLRQNPRRRTACAGVGVCDLRPHPHQLLAPNLPSEVEMGGARVVRSYWLAQPRPVPEPPDDSG